MESSKDIKFITEETLDFELFSSLDGTDCRQEEAESITCPLELSGKSAAQAVDLNILLEENDGRAKETIPQWSPLTPMKLEEIMKEANLLAMRFEKCQLLEKQNISSETKLETVLEHELLPSVRFLCAETKSPQNSRRKTFNVKNSPLEALLPRVEPVTCLAQGSPKCLFSEGRSPSCRLVDLPSPRRLQNTSYVCSSDVPQAKLSEPKALMTMTSGNKLQATIGNSGTDKPLVLPTTTKGQQPLLHLKPLPQASIRKMQRKTEASAKTEPDQGPQLQATIGNNGTDKPLVLPTTTKGQQPLLHLKPLPQASIRKMQRKTEASAKNRPDQGPKVSSNQGTVLAAQVKGKPNPQMRLWQTSPVKKIPAAPEKMAPLQKTNASQVKTMGGNGPQKQAGSKPHGGSCQIQTRHTAVPALASQLPKPTNHRAAVSGRYTVPGKSSQFKPMSSEASGGQRSTKPTAGVGKKASCQKPFPPGTFQNSRLRLPKTSSNSK